ncbi:DMT family transporter [Mangrovibrevibacter kandeliae]|uniref:DMT family transporter n=1 Tax=Mangrovibrevibacter kandeliae TaxID=2968473 RepID=UPI0021197BF7|nr:DMT family transporter [Aurantimonas sp. MSK8Z-1]MCQ8784148.1 DMT family transporter [Aurantimonas sp. CSK15Z-1]MCW4116867.1 DMT family transporter [Aurantimonas sp. MSK8Z-1]
MSRLLANSLLLFVGAVWGLGFVAQSSAMAAIGPWAFVTLRYLLAGLTLLPLALWESRRAPRALTRRERIGFVTVGLCLFGGSILQQYGLLSTSVTNAGFLTGLYVVLTPLIGLLLWREWPHWVVWPAASACALGILLVGGGTLTRLGSGDGLVVLCAVFWSLQILATGRFAGNSGRPFTLSAVQFFVAAALGGLGWSATEPFSSATILRATPELLFAGIIAAGLAFTLQTVAQRHTTAAQAAIFLSSEALFAAVFGAVFLTERIGVLGYAGCALIFVAMLAVELVPMRRRGRREPPAGPQPELAGETV